jgi:hypothetical protein
MKLPVLSGEKVIDVRRKFFSFRTIRSRHFHYLSAKEGVSGGSNLQTIKKINVIFF